MQLQEFGMEKNQIERRNQVRREKKKIDRPTKRIVHPKKKIVPQTKPPRKIEKIKKINWKRKTTLETQLENLKKR